MYNIIDYFGSNCTKHMKNIFQKLDVSNRHQAVESAVELGILTGR